MISSKEFLRALPDIYQILWRATLSQEDPIPRSQDGSLGAMSSIISSFAASASAFGMICMKRSACPLALSRYAEVMICSIPESLRTFENSSLTQLAPPSVTDVHGLPCWHITLIIDAAEMLVAVWSRKETTITYLEKAHTVTRM